MRCWGLRDRGRSLPGYPWQWRRRLALVACVLGSGCVAAAVCFAGLRGSVAAGQVQSRSRAGAIHVLVAYHTLTGNTERLAYAVAEGAKRVPGVKVLLKRVGQVTPRELEAAHAIILGCPTHFANITAEMKAAIDCWNWKWKVDLTDKIGGAFATGGGQMGGKEHVVVALLLFCINNRMIVAGPLYEDETGEDKWGELGAGAMTGPIDPGLSEAELDSGRRLGERIARVARRFHGWQPAQAEVAIE